MWSEKQAKALQAVFEALNKSGIPWLVLRNYEGLPWNNRSKDIDIGVKKRDFSKAYKVISKSLKEHQFSLFTDTKFQYAWCLNFFNVTDNFPCEIKIDIVIPFVWRGAEIVSFEELYENKISHGDFYVPSRTYAGFMLWVKPLMTGGFIKDKYREDILHVIRNYPQEFFMLIQKKLGNNLFYQIKPILERGNLDETVKLKRQICYAAYFVALKKQPINTILSTIEHFFKELQRRFQRPKGSMITIIGPDGSGKSTVADHLKEALCHIMSKDHHDVQIPHFRPNIFPNLKKLLSGKSYDESKEEFTSPHRAAPAGLLSSFFRLTYYWLDYVIGYWFFIRRHCVAGKIFIFDRYFYDFIVDPFRSRIKLPNRILFLFLKITPKPDMAILLNCDSRTIYERKKELPQVEIERQLKIYNKLANKYSNFFVVDSNKSVDKIVNYVTREYIKRIAKPMIH